MTIPLEAARKRDRTMVLFGLAVVTSVCWWYALRPAGHAHHQAGLAGALVLWIVMMAGMMLPSAAPRVLGLAGQGRRDAGPRASLAPATAFACGYLTAWAGFSVLAALAEWGVRWAAHARPALESAAPLLGGGLLVAAGLYQFTPLKRTCLAHCRGPLRPPTGGSFTAGLGDGAVCIGSCWGLMLVLFVTGAMSPWAMVALTALVLVEKLAPGGQWFGRAAGVALVLWGVAQLGGV